MSTTQKVRRLIAVLAGGAAVAVTVVYVALPAGPKTWNVTPTSTPSLLTAEAQAQPGDKVVLSGKFTTPFVPKVSGTASAPITYQSTSGATFDVPAPTVTATISGRSYIVLDGLTFTDSNYIAKPATNRGVILRASNHITFTHDTFTHMQMQLIGTSFSTINNNMWNQFVASYVNGQPQTSGDMLNLVLGSHDNTISGNNMKYAGHSLIEIGNGTGNGETNANNTITGNVLSNPWYRDLALSDNGAGTVVDGNQILDANSVPTLYSTVAGRVGQLNTASNAVQIDGENFTLSNNTISNAVCIYGCVTFGGRWYYGVGAAPGGTLVEAQNDQVFGNTLSSNKGAAVFSFIENYTPGTDASVPAIAGITIRDNTLTGNVTSGAYSWDKSSHFETVIYRSFKGAPAWVGLGGNQFYANTGVSLTGAYRYSYVSSGLATTLHVYSLAQFEASDPFNIHGNS